MNQLGMWASHLPSTWEAKPLKAVASYVVSNVDKIPLDDELPVRLCNYTDVYNNEYITPDLELMQGTATPHEISKFHLLKDDVVITKDSETWDDIAIPALVVETADDLVCGYHLAILRANKERMLGQFLFRCLQAKEIRLQLELASTGVTRFGLPKDEIGKLLLPVPPHRIQKDIADYLDTETAQIDALISEKQKLLSLLAEKRAALISRVVTHGLDPKAPMKASGIEWLGHIPAHWEVRRLKFLTEEPLTYGANEAGLEDDPLLPRFVRITDIAEDGSLRPDTFKSLPPEIAELYLLKEGDVLFARSGATVGKSFIYRPEWGIACYAGYLIRFGCDQSKLLPEFLYAFTLSSAYWQQVRAGLIQATIQNFSAEKYGNIWIALPKPNEQTAILNHLKEILAHLDDVRKTTMLSIVLLKERRSVLITAAVTGQIKPETMKTCG